MNHAAANRSLPRCNETWVLTVSPPPWYAGRIGARAMVDLVEANAIYVRFESGLRESFPRGRFFEYFSRAQRRAVGMPR